MEQQSRKAVPAGRRWWSSSYATEAVDVLEVLRAYASEGSQGSHA